VGKKIKSKQKKNDDVSFLPTDLPTELPTEQIPSVIPSVNLLVNCEHCSITDGTKGITDGTFRRYFPESKSPTD